MRTYDATKVSYLDLASPGSIAQGKSVRVLRLAVSVLLLFVGCALPCARATTVWVDTDASIGSPFRDVDDAFAILLALRCSNLKIAGISTTYGNAPLQTTTAVTTDLIRRFGGRIHPVHSGARSPRDLGRETVGTTQLAQAVRTNGRLTYLSLGPLTNFATFAMRYPQLAKRIDRLVFVGGQIEGTSLRFGLRHPISIHDANVFKDPEAVRTILNTNIPVTLIPVLTASAIQLDQNDLIEIGRSSQAGNFLQKKSRVWLWFWKHFVGMAGGPIFDAAGVAAAADPTLLVLERRSASVDSTGNLLVSRKPMPHSRTVLCCPRLPDAARRFVRQKLGVSGIEPETRAGGR
jgi:pyrimidine-specific ribonucleoside hydrolase